MGPECLRFRKLVLASVATENAEESVSFAEFHSFRAIMVNMWHHANCLYPASTAEITDCSNTSSS